MTAGLLDPALNIAPAVLRHIHLVGICGTGMAALAGMLHLQGFQVTGSDQNVYPPMSDFLAGLGIPVQEGYAAANLAGRPDLVVVGNVVRATNPEAVELARLRIPYLSMPQALGHFFLSSDFPWWWPAHTARPQPPPCWRPPCTGPAALRDS